MTFLNQFRPDFPILSQKINGRQLVYLDNAATTQKPMQVIQRVIDFYKNENSNIHRGIHSLSQNATEMVDLARINIQKFINSFFPLIYQIQSWDYNQSLSLKFTNCF